MLNTPYQFDSLALLEMSEGLLIVYGFLDAILLQRSVQWSFRVHVWCRV